jgi:hypothetical protein
MAITPPEPTDACMRAAGCDSLLGMGIARAADVNTASPALMEAMGMTAETAASIVAAPATAV